MRSFWSCLYIAVVIFLIVGEVLCILKFVRCDFEAPLRGELIYGVGFLTGLGGILGWFNFGK